MVRAGLMSTTELDQVQALIERVLPDPGGFAQRLLMQAMARWGQAAGPGAAASEPRTSAFYTVAASEDAMTSETVMRPEHPAPAGPPVDTNMLLAEAVGACECWGLKADCRICQGQGSAGWNQPDPTLFEEFVGPAMTKLPGGLASDEQRHGAAKTDENHHYQTAPGENT
jgi:hypothetical protein